MKYVMHEFNAYRVRYVYMGAVKILNIIKYLKKYNLLRRRINTVLHPYIKSKIASNMTAKFRPNK